MSPEEFANITRAMPFETREALIEVARGSIELVTETLSSLLSVDLSSTVEPCVQSMAEYLDDVIEGGAK